jgi:hypothetical protein
VDDDDGGGAASGSPNPGWGPEQVCQQLLGCLAVVDPEQVAAVMPLYGESGTCWQSATDRSLCETSCRAQLAELHDRHWEEPACEACQTDADCGDDLICRAGTCIAVCAESEVGCCQELCIAERRAGCPRLYCDIDCSQGLYAVGEGACQAAYVDLVRCEVSLLPDGMACATNLAPHFLTARCDDECAVLREAANAACAPLQPGKCESPQL